MQSDSVLTLPPVYSTPAPPLYSLDPAVEEQTLQRTPQSSQSNVAHTSSTRTVGSITVTLENQVTRFGHASYSQNTLVEGTITLDSASEVREIRVKLKGRLTTSVKQSSSQTVKLVDSSFTLWEEEEGSIKPCQQTVPFTIPFPSAFQYNGSTYPLPPSYTLREQGPDHIEASSAYSLIVTVVYKSSKFLTWLKTKRIVLPVFYFPRSRPARPMSLSSADIDDMKTHPEEWYQSLSEIKSKSSTIASLYVSAFLPDGRIYGLSDVIPFHLQISGPVQSLGLLSACQPKSGSLSLSVKLIRLATVETKGVSATHTDIIGEGEVRALPPSVLSVGEDLDWEGDIRILKKGISSVAFDVPGVHVRDLILVSFSQSTKLEQSPFLPFRIVVPIRLTTESWRDGHG